VAAGRSGVASALRGVLGAGGMGFLATCAAALLVIGGLWAVAREGPSARSAVAPEPPPTAVTVRGRFGAEAFPTARPVRARTPAAVVPGAGLPRRRGAAAPPATVMEVIVGTIRDGDGTGGEPARGGGGRSGVGVRSSPVPGGERLEE